MLVPTFAPISAQCSKASINSPISSVRSHTSGTCFVMFVSPLRAACNPAPATHGFTIREWGARTSALSACCDRVPTLQFLSAYCESRTMEWQVNLVGEAMDIAELAKIAPAFDVTLAPDRDGREC